MEDPKLIIGNVMPPVTQDIKTSEELMAKVRKQIDFLNVGNTDSNKVDIKWPNKIESVEVIGDLQPLPSGSIESMKKNLLQMRQFESGATRDIDIDKIDPEACLCPLVIERYAQYILDCSYLPDGSRRSHDNWQKGISLTSYMKSNWRHLLHAWQIHRGYKIFDQKTKKPISIEEALCGIMFNTMGYLHEILKRPALKE